MNFIKDYISRRTFLKRTLLTLVSFELVYVFINLMKNIGKKEDMENLFNAGDVSLFEKERIYPFSTGRFYLSRLNDGGFLAISTKCTHLGCTVQFKNKDDKFLCPCHASAFDKYGEVLSPPATRALDILPITISKGKVWVDINSPVKRKKYESSQVTYS